jgi:hypothetical protein
MDDNGESQALLMKQFVPENKPYRIRSSSGEESCSQLDGGVELAQVADPHNALPQTLAVGKLQIHYKCVW